jgi:signal transduction histidine kinase
LNGKLLATGQFADQPPDTQLPETYTPQQTYAPQQIVNFVEKFGGQIKQNPVPQQGAYTEKPESINKLQSLRAADRGGKEFLKRQESYSVNTLQWADNNRAMGNTYPVIQQMQAQPVVEGVMRPIWVGDELVLARRTRIEGQDVLQCCWLAWNRIQEILREEVRDILPEVQFEPVRDEEDLVPGRALVTLPAQVVVDVPELLSMHSLTVDQAGSPQFSGVRIALWLAWCGLALSAVAVGSLLFGVIRLSERRASFVSAVTHELRTPLTTFKMYSEMLADDMVPPDKRHQYASTLKTQADRLSHLVENVLQFARLERGAAEPRLQRMSVDDLVDRFRESLIERANQAGMGIRFHVDEVAGNREVNMEPRTIEQILFNLVDNACKYASACDDAAIEINVEKSDRFLRFVVRDFGPGVDAKYQNRLFQPFCKSDLEAANSAPGVGLGLALCRRMARSLGGKLEFQSGDPGARFILQLPLGN